MQPTYQGPYNIIKRANKHFTVQKNVKNDSVAIDRLKTVILNEMCDMNKRDVDRKLNETRKQSHGQRNLHQQDQP